MDGFFGDWADLNGDGEVDNFEKLVDYDFWLVLIAMSCWNKKMTLQVTYIWYKV